MAKLSSKIKSLLDKERSDRSIDANSLVLLLGVYYKYFKSVKQIFGVGENHFWMIFSESISSSNAGELGSEVEGIINQSVAVFDTCDFGLQSKIQKHKQLEEKMALKAASFVLRSLSNDVEVFLSKLGLSSYALIRDANEIIEVMESDVLQEFLHKSSNTQSVLNNVNSNAIRIGDIHQEINYIKKIFIQQLSDDQDREVNDLRMRDMADSFLKYLGQDNPLKRKRIALFFLTRCQYSPDLPKELREEALYLKGLLEAMPLQEFSDPKRIIGKTKLGYFLLGSVTGLSSALVASLVNKNNRIELHIEFGQKEISGVDPDDFIGIRDFDSSVMERFDFSVFFIREDGSSVVLEGVNEAQIETDTNKNTNTNVESRSENRLKNIFSREDADLLKTLDSVELMTDIDIEGISSLDDSSYIQSSFIEDLAIQQKLHSFSTEASDSGENLDFDSDLSDIDVDIDDVDINIDI